MREAFESAALRRAAKEEQGVLNRPHNSAQISLHKSALFLLHSSPASLTPSKPFKSLPWGLHFPSGPAALPLRLPLDPAWIPQRLPFSVLPFLDQFWKCFLWSPSCEFHDFGLHLGSPKSSQNRSKVVVGTHAEFGPAFSLIFGGFWEVKPRKIIEKCTTVIKF